MIRHDEIEQPELIGLIKKGELRLGGNANLKIYGQLGCKSGKRMLRKNRVFFQSEEETLAKGYRPCGHCMRESYLVWKSSLAQTKVK